MCGRPVTVSTNRVKPAYILNGTDCRNSTFNLLINATPSVATPATPPQPSTWTTHSGSHIHVPSHFNISATSSARWLMWECPTVKRALPNQCSPHHFQRPLISAPPSGNSIKIPLSDTLASVTTMLASRHKHNSKFSSSQLCQRLAALIRPASCCKEQCCH
jgi:hypothetical protein